MQGKYFPIRCRNVAARYLAAMAGRGFDRHATDGLRGGTPRRSSGWLDARLTREIALADRDSLPPQNVVGRGCVKIEIRLRKGQQKILRGEVEMPIAERKAHIAADKSVDFGRLNR